MFGFMKNHALEDYIHECLCTFHETLSQPFAAYSDTQHQHWHSKTKLALFKAEKRSSSTNENHLSVIKKIGKVVNPDKKKQQLSNYLNMTLPKIIVGLIDLK